METEEEENTKEGGDHVPRGQGLLLTTKGKLLCM